MYLAIPFFTYCTDLQPLFLVNWTDQEITYVGRKLYAYASDDEGVTEFSGSTSAFADKIATSATIAPGGRLMIGDYSMRVDGDFVSNYRLVVSITLAHEITPYRSL